MLTNRNNITYFLLCFLVAMYIGCFVRETFIHPSLWINILDFMQSDFVQQMGDGYHFALGATDVYHAGWFQKENYWLIHLWPPGFMYLESMIIKCFGLNAPFIFILIVLNSFFLAFLLMLCRIYLLTILPIIAASLLPFLFFCFPLIRFFLLEPGAIVLGEGFSIVFFLNAILLTLLSFKNNSLAQAIWAGILLACSAYFRSQFEVLVNFLTMIAIFMYVLIFVKKIRHSKVNILQKKVLMKTIFLVILTAHIIMMPWRIHNFKDTKTFSWVYTSNLVYENASKTDAQLSGSAGFIVSGGGNLACKLEPAYCGKPSKKAFYRVFFSHIGEWYKQKIHISLAYWFASLKDYASVYYRPSFFDILWNTLYLVFVLITFPLLWYIRRHPDALIYVWICTSFYACFFVIFTLVHFETRYFYAMKIFSVFTSIILGSIAWSRLSSARKKSVNFLGGFLLTK